jgi:hypothetical protein
MCKFIEEDNPNRKLHFGIYGAASEELLKRGLKRVDAVSVNGEGMTSPTEYTGIVAMCIFLR